MDQDGLKLTDREEDVQPRLRRVLGLWDLIIYGIVLIQPIAPVGIFGIAQELSRGHAVTTIIVAMFAMMLTAFSYGRMAGLYPSAGSAFTYVTRGLNAHFGFMVGWAMVLDYLMIPLINTIFGSLTLWRLIPGVPYVVWVIVISGGIVLLNLRGIQAAAWANSILLLVMSLVVAAFVILGVHYLFHRQGWSGVFSFQPFYDPRTFGVHAIATATSLAALTYIGFDGVTMLAEEVREPKRTVPLATVLVCLFTGIFSAVEVYLGQRIWPDYHTFPNLATAYLDVSRRAGGPPLFDAMGIILFVACVGSGLTGQLGAARLLYAMGRDNVIPRRLFGHLNARHSTPSYNICMVSVLVFAGALLLSYERVAELLNFGAFLGFMGVNIAAIRELYFRPGKKSERHLLTGVIIPGLGFLFCLSIWCSLPLPAKIAGGIWLGFGIAYEAIKTRGFQTAPSTLDFDRL